MKIVKLSKQFRRELKAHPGKSAVLGVLVAVALYFWAPLVWRFANRESPAHVVAPVAPVAAVGWLPNTTPAAEVEGTQPMSTFPWEDLARSIDRDARMRSTSAPPRDVNPFVSARNQAVDTEPNLDEPIEPVDRSPEELGIVVSGTLVGPRRRTALINGRVYSEGRLLTSEDGMEFVLAEVNSGGVVLERNGLRFELSIPRPDKSTQIEIQPGH